MKNYINLFIAIALSSLLVTEKVYARYYRSSRSNAPLKGLLGGAIGGAALGGIAGGKRGAGIGAGVGAGLGLLSGVAARNRRDRRDYYNNDYYYEDY